MEAGGFDVVIGNPPYVRIQTLPRDEAEYYRHHYESAFGSFDIYVIFIEQGLRLLKPGGRLGFITSGKFLKAEYGKKLQQHIRREATVEEIVDLSAQQVFADATTYPVMLVLRKGAGERRLRYTFVPEGSEPGAVGTLGQMAPVEVEQAALTRGTWPPIVGSAKTLLDRLQSHTVPMDRIMDRAFQGLITGADDIFIVRGVGEPFESLMAVADNANGLTRHLESSLLHPVLVGSRHVHRWRTEQSELFIIFPYEFVAEKAHLIEGRRLEKEFPNTWQYLSSHKRELENREHGRWRVPEWYKFGRHQNLIQFLQSSPRILATSIASEPSFALDLKGRYFFTGGGSSGVYGLVLKPNFAPYLEFVLALLNSRLLGHLLKSLSSPFQGGWYVQRPQYLRRLPIRVLDLGKPGQRRQHDGIVTLVEEMLGLQERLGPIRSVPSEQRAELERRVAQVDRAIDEAVYALYGLTDAERRLVEGEG